jgi:hypothetical protein
VSTALHVIVGIVLLLLIFLAYFLPTIIAAYRDIRLVAAVIVINLFLGWTFIGWVVALAMAVSGEEKKP